MKALHKNRLLKLAEFLDKLPKEKFDFSSVISKNEGKCGTICCAVGWLPTVFPRSWMWDFVAGDETHINVFRKVPNGEDTKSSHHWHCDFWVDVSKFFGMTEKEVEQLFFPEMDRPWDPDFMLGEEATANEVADSIRDYITWKEN